MYESFKGGGLRDKIGHHKIGACAEIGQNWIIGGWGVKKTQKKCRTSLMYVPLASYSTLNVNVKVLEC